MRWLDHDVDSCSPHTHQVLRAVRLPLLPPDVLLDCVWTHRLVSASPKSMELVRRALVQHLSPTHSRAADEQVGEHLCWRSCTPGTCKLE